VVFSWLGDFGQRSAHDALGRIYPEYHSSSSREGERGKRSRVTEGGGRRTEGLFGSAGGAEGRPPEVGKLRCATAGSNSAVGKFLVFSAGFDG